MIKEYFSLFIVVALLTIIPKFSKTTIIMEKVISRPIACENEP